MVMPDCGVVAARGLECGTGSGAADLAAGRVAGARETEAAWQAVVE